MDEFTSYGSSISFSNLPEESSSSDFWANIISTLAGAGVAAYSISQGGSVGTTTQAGTTTIQTGTAAQQQTNMMIMIGAIAVIALLLFARK